MRRIGLFILCVLLVAANACTSSSTPTNISTGTGGYDDNYEASARRSQQQQQGAAEQPRTDEDPPVVIMLMSMETGDVYPGEDYYVYAVVDNLDNRDLEYVWSVANGDVREVPEAERGRLATLVETEYDYAQATAAPGVEPAVDEAVPVEGEETPPAEGTGAGTGEQPPEGAGLPGQPPAGTGEPPEGYNPEERLGGGTGSPGTAPPIEGGTAGQPAEQQGELPASMEAPEDIWTNDEINKFSETKYKLDMGEDPQPEQHEIEMMQEYFDYYDMYNEWLSQQGGTAWVPTGAHSPGSELRIVAGEDDDVDEEDSSNVEALAEQLAESIAESAAEAGGEEAASAQNVAEESSDTGASWVGRETPGLNEGRALGLRSEYEVWRDESGEPRRRNLGGYGDPAEVEALDVDESYETHTLVTEEPYILWTPRLPGDVRIYVKATYKDEELTEPMELAVTVRLRDPAVELSDDFPDIVREDESVYVALDASNIPAFYKGLLTLTFDANKLSFREAELGEFFDDVPSASLFYAQPDKLDGRVLLAIDSNTELGQLGGDGTLLYVKFKAKQDIADQAETQLALVLDSSARYILNREGENVLPLPTTYPIYRTATTMPALLPEYTRDRTPGSKVGEEPPAGEQPPAGAQPADGQVPAAAGGLPPAPEYGSGGGSPYIPAAGVGGGAPPTNGGGVPPTNGGGVPPTNDGGVPPTNGGGVPPTDGTDTGDGEGEVPQDARPYDSVSEAEAAAAAAEGAAEGEKESAAEATGEEDGEPAAVEAEEETEEPEEPAGEEPASEPTGDGSSSG